MRTRLVVASMMLALLAASAAQAEVKLPSILSDNMVVQQGKTAAFWGLATPGETVTVKFAAETATTTTDKDGRWKVEIKPPSSGGPYEVEVAGSNTIVIKNVLVGEVWLCAGQSNMQFPLANPAVWGNAAAGGKEEAATANYPEIRQFAIAVAPMIGPQFSCSGQWVVCSPATAGKFTAVGYFFGKAIHQELKAPVGLINNAVGGTPIESWLERSIMMGDPEFNKVVLERQAKTRAGIEKSEADYKVALAKWKEQAASAQAAGQPVAAEPRKPWNGATHMPGLLYNGEVTPITPYKIAGALWYQGESHDGNKLYGKLLTKLIESYRQVWGEGDFPFLVVQLTSFGKVTNEPDESGGWMVVREGELQATSLPKVGLAVTMDLGDPVDIHPVRKKEVGDRLALAALAIAYDKKIVFSGPIYQSFAVEGNKVRLKFKYVGSGLEAKGETLKGFAVAGADKKFVWAEAKIEGTDVVVTSDKVAAPVAVRYGWAAVSDCNLYNKEGLPASPFRTDEG